jgi:hypothetical protein
MPYASSWDLLEVIRTSPALRSRPFVITTPNTRKLEDAVGATPAIEIAGRDPICAAFSKRSKQQQTTALLDVTP